MQNVKRKILVVGNISSGKSTFLNSILHTDILPTSNLACTAKEIKIIVKNKNKTYISYLNQKRKYLKDDGNCIMKDLNENGEKNQITIIGPSVFKHLDGCEIYDSPGINNSMDTNHKAITLKSLKKKKIDRVIFLMNAENLFTTDDKETLESIIAINPKLKDKIYIVINKMDKIKLTGESTNKEIKEKCVKFLKNLEIEKKPSEIYLFSALYFTLERKEQKSRSETRLLSLLEDIYSKREIKEMHKIRKKILL